MQNTLVTQNLVMSLLQGLGNNNPTPAQLKLAHSLCLTSYFQYERIFHEKFSSREQACLWLAAQGESIKGIAHLLDNKHSTIVTLRKRLLGKLKCKNMAQAVFVGIQYQYLPPTLMKGYEALRSQDNEEGIAE
jgi:DNA-binding NarL/FixJ family response regulator